MSEVAERTASGQALVAGIRYAKRVRCRFKTVAR
jgi:hypothetical protein